MEPYWRKTRSQQWAEALYRVRGAIADLPPPVRVALVIVAAVIGGLAL